MKAKVLKTFKDKKTKEVYKPDTVITVSESRFKEIEKVGDFLEEVKEVKEPEEAKEEVKEEVKTAKTETKATKKPKKAETGDK